MLRQRYESTLSAVGADGLAGPHHDSDAGLRTQGIGDVVARARLGAAE